MCLSAPCFLATLLAEALSSEPELLQRSPSHGHHGNFLQGTKEGAGERVRNLPGGPRRKPLSQRDFKVPILGLLYRALLYIGYIISGKVALGQFLG